MDDSFHERYRHRLGDELRVSVKLLLGQLSEGDNCLDDNSPQLERFCLVMEKAFLHGLQDTIWGRKKYYWDFIQNITKLHGPARHSIENVLGLSQVRTPAGRGRAWIRFALIEKKLEKYMRMLIADRADIAAKWYENYALFRVREDYDIFVGFLAPLSMVDFSICLKDIDFDNLPTELGLYSIESLTPPAVAPPPAEASSHATPSAAAEQQQQQPPGIVQAAGEVEVTPRSKKEREREKEKRALLGEREKWKQLLEAREAEWKEKTASMEDILARKEAHLAETAAQLNALTVLGEKVAVKEENGRQPEPAESEGATKKSPAGVQQEGEIERLHKERLLLEAQVHQLKDEIQGRDASLVRLNEELAALTTAKNDLQRRLHAAKDSTQRERQSSTSSEQERSRIASLEAELSTLKAESATAAEELQRVREELRSASERLDKVEAELMQARTEAQAAVDEAQSLRRECNQLRDSVLDREAQLQREKVDAAQRLAQRDDDIHEVKVAHEAAMATLTSTLNQSRDNERQAEAEARTAKEELSRAYEGLKTKNAEVQRLEEEANEARREKEKLARSLDTALREKEREGLGQEEVEGALKQELQETNQRLEELIRREELLTEQTLQHQRREKEAKEGFERELKQLRQAHDEQILRLRNKSKAKSALVDTKTRELDDVVRERDEAQAQLRLAQQDAQRANEIQQANVDKLQADLSRLQDERETEAKQADERLLVTYREKESTERELAEKMHTWAEEKATLLQQLNEQRDELCRKETEATKTAADAKHAHQQELDAALARASAAEAELSQVQQKMASEHERRNKAEQECDALREEKQKKEKEMDGLMKLLRAKEARIEETQRDAEQYRRTAEDAARETAEQVRALEVERKQQLDLVVSLRQTEEELRASNAALKQQIEQDAAEIVRLRASVASARDNEDTKALVAQMHRQLGELLSKAQRDKDEIARYRQDAEEQRRAADDLKERLRTAEEESRNARLAAETQGAELEELRRVVERKDEIIKESKQLINDRERRIREFMNKGNVKASNSVGHAVSEDPWVVLDDKTQHRLLDDMRNVLQVTKQMVEEKAYEIDGLQDQLQAKVAREQELQARIDQLQAEATGLKATVSTLAEQGAVLKRLLALHNDSTNSRSAPNSPLSRPN